MRKKAIAAVALILVGTFFVAFGFNTVDQMIIRYKFYGEEGGGFSWRAAEHWEMSYFWKPRWWDIYILSVLMLVVGGALLGVASKTVYDNLE